MRLYEARLHYPLNSLTQKDYKSRLQELTQGLFKETPVYQVTGVSGPDHKASYLVSVSFKGKELGKGVGPSKKSASQDAAKNALTKVTIWVRLVRVRESIPMSRYRWQALFPFLPSRLVANIVAV